VLAADAAAEATLRDGLTHCGENAFSPAARALTSRFASTLP
jgi:hypothetical protein